MTKRNKRFTAAFAVLIMALVPQTAFAGDGEVSLSGSIKNESGALSFHGISPYDLPDAATSDWYSRTSARATVSGESETATFRAEAWASFDHAAGTWGLSLDEAWGEWKPHRSFGARLGRARLAFGPCLAFSPANSFTSKDVFDDRANKVGLDGLTAKFIPLAAFGLDDSPVAISVEASLFLPSGPLAAKPAVPIDLDESSAFARVGLYLPGAGILGPTEIGLCGDARRIGTANGSSGSAAEGLRPCAAGAWLSMDVAGFVIGAEGAVRTPGYAGSAATNAPLTTGAGESEAEWAFGINRKIGDVFCVVEADYSTIKGEWTAFARIAWTGDDLDLSVSAMTDTATGSTRAGLEANYTISDSIVIGLAGTWNYLPEKWDYFLPAAWAAGASLEFFY